MSSIISCDKNNLVLFVINVCELIWFHLFTTVRNSTSVFLCPKLLLEMKFCLGSSMSYVRFTLLRTWHLSWNWISFVKEVSGWVFRPNAKAACRFACPSAWLPSSSCTAHTLRPIVPGPTVIPSTASRPAASGGAWQGAGRATLEGDQPRSPGPRGPEGAEPRQQTCSAHVTPAMPPPTTTNVPTDRAASMLPGGRPRAADSAPVTCEPSSTRKGSCPHSHFRRPFHGLWTTGAWKLHTIHLSIYRVFCIWKLGCAAAFPEP